MPEEAKRRRNGELLAVQQEATAAANREFVGQTVSVLVEGESKLVSRQAPAAPSPGGVELGWERRPESAGARNAYRTQLVGRTRGDQVVCFDGDLSLKGEILDVQITDSRGMTLFARLADPVAVTT